MLDRESACNRVFLARRFVLFGADGVGFGSSLLVRFQAGRCPEIDNVVIAALLPHQPDQLRRRLSPCQQCCEPGPMLCAMDLGITDHGERAGHEQAPQIAVTLFADTAELIPTSTGVLLGY